MENLYQVGYNHHIKEYITQQQLGKFIPGRVIRQNKGRYTVLTAEGMAPAEITGNLRYTANDSTDFPTVGDWVLMIGFEDLFLINHIIPRQTVLERKSVAAHGETQLMAANIDIAFIVQGLDHDFNLNRLERYLSIVYAGDITPVILLNKADLQNAAEKARTLEKVKTRIGEKVQIILTSFNTGEGLEALNTFLEKGKTYCLIGSSGVGKSSLINALRKSHSQLTAEVSEATGKGKHTTTRREVILLENGGVIIDTPGMRELGVVNNGVGMEKTFGQIAELAKACRFKDCTHQEEPGCAVRKAVEKGAFDPVVLLNFQKMKKESRQFQASVAEKRKKERAFGKIYRESQKFRKKNKY